MGPFPAPLAAVMGAGPGARTQHRRTDQPRTGSSWETHCRSCSALVATASPRNPRPEFTASLPPVMGNLSWKWLLFGEKCKVFQITFRKDRIQTSVVGDVLKQWKKVCYPVILFL